MTEDPSKPDPDPEFTLFVKTYQAIARRTPAIWDVLGPLSLNPQPLPPEPPPETYGAYAGRELLQLFWAVDKFGLESGSTDLKDLFPEVGDQKKFTLPPWMPQPPVDEIDNAWRAGFYLGLLCALAMDENVDTRTSRTRDLAGQASEELADILKHPTRPR